MEREGLCGEAARRGTPGPAFFWRTQRQKVSMYVLEAGNVLRDALGASTVVLVGADAGLSAVGLRER